MPVLQATPVSQMCSIRIQQTLSNQGERLIHSEHTRALSPNLTKMAVSNPVKYPSLFACHLYENTFLFSFTFIFYTLLFLKASNRGFAHSTTHNLSYVFYFRNGLINKTFWKTKEVERFNGGSVKVNCFFFLLNFLSVDKESINVSWLFQDRKKFPKHRDSDLHRCLLKHFPFAFILWYKSLWHTALPRAAIF